MGTVTRIVDGIVEKVRKVRNCGLYTGTCSRISFSARGIRYPAHHAVRTLLTTRSKRRQASLSVKSFAIQSGRGRSIISLSRLLHIIFVG